MLARQSGSNVRTGRAELYTPQPTAFHKGPPPKVSTPFKPVPAAADQVSRRLGM